MLLHMNRWRRWREGEVACSPWVCGCRARARRLVEFAVELGERASVLELVVDDRMLVYPREVLACAR